MEVQEKTYTTEVLRLTSRLLTWNPEYYTVWNYRRRIRQHLNAEKSNENDEKAMEAFASDWIANDLQFLVPILIKFPKCYWIWNYRSWLLQQASGLLPAAITRELWKGELLLVSKMLSRDSRNFHGWGYRRIVVSALESSELATDLEPRSMAKEELDYTTRMIKTNLSNFSAWHNRSKLIPRLLDESGADDSQRRKMLDEGIRTLPSVGRQILTQFRT